MFHTNQYNASTGEKKWTKKGKQNQTWYRSELEPTKSTPYFDLIGKLWDLLYIN